MSRHAPHLAVNSAAWAATKARTAESHSAVASAPRAALRTGSSRAALRRSEHTPAIIDRTHGERVMSTHGERVMSDGSCVMGHA